MSNRKLKERSPMRDTRILTMALVLLTTLASTRAARAIGVPDLGSTCTTATGNNGCFAVTNNNTTQTLQDGNATGTAFTAVTAGNGTALKGFTNGGSSGSALMGVST